MTVDEGALRDAAEARNAAAIVAAHTAERFLAVATSIAHLDRAVTSWREAQDRYNALADQWDTARAAAAVGGGGAA